MIETVINQLGHYSITPDGEFFLMENLNELKRELEETYLPKAHEYFQALLSRSED